MRFRNELDPGFSAAVRHAFRTYLERHQDHRFADARLVAKGTGLLLVWILAYAGILADPGPVYAFFLAILAGIAALLLAMNVGHDAAHECFTRWPSVDHALQRVSFMLLGVDAYLWRFRHRNSHHHFPNVNGCDIDIDENPFLRLSPNQPRRPHFRWQHLYAPVVYCMTVFDTVFVQDFMYLYKRRLANLQDIHHPPAAHISFYLSKMAFAMLVFVLPLLLTSLTWWQILIGYSGAAIVVSLLFIFLLIGTHFSDTATFPVVGPDGTLPGSWATHAVETSRNWATSSAIANFLTGGANCHAAHHLFPKVSHRHYPVIAPMIRAAAHRFNTRYVESTFPAMISSHFRFLSRMAKSPYKTPAPDPTLGADASVDHPDGVTRGRRVAERVSG